MSVFSTTDRTASARALTAVLIWTALTSIVVGQDQETVRIWPNGLPTGSVKLDAETIGRLTAEQKKHPRGHVLYVDSPSLTVFPADRTVANGCAVVICPGGGYNVLAWRHEGTDVAKWFNSIGVSAFVLRYRVPRRTAEGFHREPMQDIQRAIRMVRHNAARFGIDPKRIGVLGFSAGGHLAVMSGVQYDTLSYDPADEVDRVSARPDFVCPIYAAYLADGYRDDKAELGPLITVDGKTPPMFLAATWDDRFRGAQAALLFARLREHGVPAEIHVWAKGGHGYGIRGSDDPVSGWHRHMQTWLEKSGFLTRPESDSADEPRR